MSRKSRRVSPCRVVDSWRFLPSTLSLRKSCSHSVFSKVGLSSKALASDESRRIFADAVDLDPGGHGVSFSDGLELSAQEQLAMRRIDDEFTGLKTLTLRRLFRAHFLVWSLTRPAGLGRGTPLRRRPPCHPSVSAFPYPSRSCGITPACASHAETHATNGCPVRPMKRCTLLFSASCQFTDPQPGSLENLKAQR